MRTLIVAGGDVPARRRLDQAWSGWDDGVGLIIAADGGALRAESAGLPPDLLVGDADSLLPGQLDRLRAADVAVELSPVAKDATDLELAVEAALARGASELVILGAFGGERLDHALGNIGLLALPALRGYRVAMLDATTRVRLLAASGSATEDRVRHPLTGRVGDLVSLLPLGGEAVGVTTGGLLYPLRDEPLTLGSSRGISNVRCDAAAWVSLRGGHLYAIETIVETTVPASAPEGATS
jgi:thiamine pyrophosphokinase